MNQNTRDAQRVFDAGVLSLGIPIDGLQTERDLAYAQKAFTRATEREPDMCDAWLGRAACGEFTPEVRYNLYRTSTTTLFREQRRLGLSPRALAGRFQTGLYIDYPLASFTEIWLAYAAGMIEEGEFGEAETTLDTLARYRPNMPERDRFSDEIYGYVRGILHFTTQRWPDVLTALDKSAGFTDDYIRCGANLMVGSACAQLGLFGEGIRRLEAAAEGPIPAAKTDADFCRGLTLREMGREEDARAIFERLYSEQPGFEANAMALNDPKYRLVITDKETIESRTDKWDPESIPDPKLAQSADEEERNAKLLEHAQEQMARQVGLGEVKTQVAKLQSSAKLAKVRAEKGLTTTSRSNHLAFTGPPGTGKTTIARIIAEIYCGLGLLKTPTVVEAKREDFVGQHLGSTAIKTSALIDSAMDGVLFIDEAYTLMQTGLSGGDAFGREAVDTLLARMENDRDRLVVIIAGYDGEIDRFLESNDGLASRFAKRIRFPSYTPAELGEIAEVIARARDSVLTPDALTALVGACEPLFATESIDQSGLPRRNIDRAGNGRFVRNVIEAAEEEREFRLSEDLDIDFESLDHDVLMRIEPDDMAKAITTVLGNLGFDSPAALSGQAEPASGATPANWA
ncbi:type VII secretion AAA-ATPase EccA [Gordonia sp. ABSL1-1]|uniref:type VII secretion AAA-ATPase EccA n=1 Tax=Gordonia sp. ABSL1-1 TaxID=3053923 RepID=UPI002573E9F3|nr:type VII secretion AAA-ATPase EccA [Gordonia sp. ABSL1-1]MDL9937763.1 type VII secretion AAA-ATPase EccA [Gordonia sp. ABSL1-1]